MLSGKIEVLCPYCGKVSIKEINQIPFSYECDCKNTAQIIFPGITTKFLILKNYSNNANKRKWEIVDTDMDDKKRELLNILQTPLNRNSTPESENCLTYVPYLIKENENPASFIGNIPWLRSAQELQITQKKLSTGLCQENPAQVTFKNIRIYGLPTTKITDFIQADKHSTSNEALSCDTHILYYPYYTTKVIEKHLEYRSYFDCLINGKSYTDFIKKDQEYIFRPVKSTIAKICNKAKNSSNACCICGDGTIEVHHIIPKTFAPEGIQNASNPEFFIKLCNTCHTELHTLLIKSPEWYSCIIVKLLEKQNRKGYTIPTFKRIFEEYVNLKQEQTNDFLKKLNLRIPPATQVK